MRPKKAMSSNFAFMRPAAFNIIRALSGLGGGRTESETVPAVLTYSRIEAAPDARPEG